jgi:hypothetical protein
MQEVQVTDYLTWEYCTDPEIQYLNCPPPDTVRNHIPQWFKDQKARNPEINIANHQTVRNCLGFRGLATTGYTIPLPETLTGHDTYFSRGQLHPEMLHGTLWANKTADGSPWQNNKENAYDGSPYEYCVRLLHWPWRAKMAPGWRLLILPYLLDWSNTWHEFAGTVEPNYSIKNDGCGIGSALKWDIPVNTENYNYYNLETAIAFKRSTTVDKGTLVFCAVPLYDPALLNKQIKVTK